MFFGIGIWFLFLSKVKRIKIKEVEKSEDVDAGVVFGKTMKIVGEDVILGRYKISDIVNSINEFVKDFNLTSKKTNIASGIVSFFSAMSLLISAILLQI